MDLNVTNSGKRVRHNSLAKSNFVVKERAFAKGGWTSASENTKKWVEILINPGFDQQIQKQ
jgi:hypothetical protein